MLTQAGFCPKSLFNTFGDYFMKTLFELSDGKTTRQAYFKKVTMEDGLKIISAAEGVTMQEETAVNKFVNIAVKYLVLVIPETGGELHIKNLAELDMVFDNPFMSIKIAEEFEKYIAPYLESLKLATNNLKGLQAQALQK